MRGFYQGDSKPEELARLKADRDRLIAIPDKLATRLSVPEQYQRLRYLREMELMTLVMRNQAMVKRQDTTEPHSSQRPWGIRDEW